MPKNQQAYKVSSLEKQFKTSRRTIYRKIARAKNYGSNGIIEISGHKFFVVSTKSGPLFYESLIEPFETISEKYFCDDCRAVVEKVVDNATKGE